MELHLIIALMLAALIGLSLGSMGSGGTIVTFPVLVYVARVPEHQAVVMSLAIVGAVSLIGGILYARKGLFQARAALLFSVPGIVGAILGAQFTRLVPAYVLSLLFAALMFVVGATMLLRKNPPQPTDDLHPERFLLMGLVVGALTGFLGVGGGFLILPALTLFGGLDMKKAVGTSLGIIAANSAAGLLGHWNHLAVDWSLVLTFLLIATAGMGAGIALANRLPEKKLRTAFAWMVLAVAGIMTTLSLGGALHAR